MNEEKALEEMSRLAGTQTEKNLRAAFAGEAQAHVKYNLSRFREGGRRRGLSADCFPHGQNRRN